MSPEATLASMKMPEDLCERGQEGAKNSVVQPLVHTRGSVSSLATRSCFRATNVREWYSGFFHSFHWSQSPCKVLFISQSCGGGHTGGAACGDQGGGDGDQQ